MAALHQVISLLVKRRVFWYHSFALPFGASLPIVLLSPLAMALFKLLQSDLYVLPVFLWLVSFCYGRS